MNIPRPNRAVPVRIMLSMYQQFSEPTHDARLSHVWASSVSLAHPSLICEQGPSSTQNQNTDARVLSLPSPPQNQTTRKSYTLLCEFPYRDYNTVATRLNTLTLLSLSRCAAAESSSVLLAFYIRLVAFLPFTAREDDGGWVAVTSHTCLESPV